MDNDDLLIDNALEVLYNHAENYNADVIYMASSFEFKDNPQNSAPAPEDLIVKQAKITEPVFDTENVGERIKLFCRGGTSVVGWRRFVRRDILIENEIKFPENVEASQDIAWIIELMYYAKRFLRIPNPLYIYRLRANSVSHKKRLDTELIKYRANLLVKINEWLCKFFCKHNFFQENPQYGWMLLDWHEKRCATTFTTLLKKVPAYKANEILTESFAEDFGEHSELISSLCASMFVGRYRESRHIEKIKELEARIKELEQK